MYKETKRQRDKGKKEETENESFDESLMDLGLRNASRKKPLVNFPATFTHFLFQTEPFLKVNS